MTERPPLLARFPFLARVPFLAWVWLAAFVWFAFVGLRLPLDEDEGFYAVAAELVGHGRLPYRDFFYPQMPLGPFVLAPFALVAARFVCLRLVTAALAAGASALVAHAVHRETRSRRGSMVAVLFFVTHELSWRWLPTLRPYALAEVCALAGFVIATPVGRLPTRRELMIAGALATLAPLARLPCAPLVGLVGLAIVLRGRDRPLTRGICLLTALLVGMNSARYPTIMAFCAIAIAFAIATVGKGGLASLRRVAWFGAGAATCTAVVLVPFMLLAEQSFVFGVFEYHAATSLFVAWPRSRPLLAAALGGGSLSELSAMGAQNVLLLVANLVALTLRRPELRVACVVGGAMVVVGSARHEPAIEHYVTPIVPYLAIGAGIVYGAIERVARGRLEKQRIAAFGAALAFFVLATLGSFLRTWGEGKMGPWDFGFARPRGTDATLAAIAEIAARHPGTVISFWPGSCLGNATRIVPGFENQFGRLVADRLTLEQRNILHVASETQLLEAVSKREPSVVIVDRGTGTKRETFAQFTVSQGYVFARSLGATDVYVRE